MEQKIENLLKLWMNFKGNILPTNKVEVQCKEMESNYANANQISICLLTSLKLEESSFFFLFFLW